MFNHYFAQLTSMGKSEKEAEKTARFMVYREIRSEVISPARTYRGIFLGVGSKRDVSAIVRNRVLAEAQDPQKLDKLIAEGQIVRDESGNLVVLDNRKELAPGRRNPNYGKPLQPFYVKTAVGLVKIDTAFKLMLLNLRQRNANLEVPLLTPVSFKANVAQEMKDRVILNDSALTKFESADDVELTKSFFDFFDAAPEDYKANLSEIKEWHKQHAEDQTRILFVEGDVTRIGEQETSTGAKVVAIADESMELDEPSVPVFVNPEIYRRIDFAEGSRVCVVGRTVQVGDAIGVECYNIVARPEFKVDKSLKAFEASE